MPTLPPGGELSTIFFLEYPTNQVAKFDADEYGMGASFCQAALGAYGIVVDSIPAVAGQTGTGTWLEYAACQERVRGLDV